MTLREISEAEEAHPRGDSGQTPRTDAAAFDDGLGTEEDPQVVVLASICSGIERELSALKTEKDDAYLQRNHLVAALARIFSSGIQRTAIEGWSDDWHGCCFIDLPSGQISYHYHDSHAHLFAGLPPYTQEWDGHDKATVHERLSSVALKTELAEAQEFHRMVEAGICVAVGCNTRESAKQHRLPPDNPYCTPAYQEVCRAVEREIAIRDDLLAAQTALAAAKQEIDLLGGMCELPCGHEGGAAHSDDGGKTIHCYLCEITAARAERDRAAAEEREAKRKNKVANEVIAAWEADEVRWRNEIATMVETWPWSEEWRTALAAAIRARAAEKGGENG